MRDYDPQISITGAGDPMVLVPGLDGTGLLFYRQVPLLARRNLVATFRLRDTAACMDDLVADLHAVVERITPDGARATIVGESFGGALALSYALAHEDRVERLVILNSFAHFSPRLRLRLGYNLLRAMPWGMMGLVRRFTAWRMHSPHTGREDLRRFHELMRATTREGYLSRLAMLGEYDVRRRLPALRVPTMLLAADRDHLVPAVQQATLMAQLVPGSTMKVLRGHGHICLIAPDLDLAALLDEWV